MTDEPKTPPPDSSETQASEGDDTSRAAETASARDDKAPGSAEAAEGAGSLPPPPDADLPRPTPESQAALTGKAPSGSSDSGTTVPAASGETKATAPPPAKPKPADASDHPLVKRLREKLGDAVTGAFTFLGQLSIHVRGERVVEACRALRDDAETPFNYLSDLTCVHWPEREDAPFELVYNLFSISKNERVRVKAQAGEDGGIESVTGVWPAANWMEREVYDLFGVRFKNHPDLRRLLLPKDWDGHPLRKDYPLKPV